MKNCGSVRLNRDRKRMQSDESLDNDCNLKKKTYEQFESFLVKRNQTRTKLEIKIILYSIILEFIFIVSNDSFNNFSLQTVKLFSIII